MQWSEGCRLHLVRRDHSKTQRPPETPMLEGSRKVPQRMQKDPFAAVNSLAAQI